MMSSSWPPCWTSSKLNPNACRPTVGDVRRRYPGRDAPERTGNAELSAPRGRPPRAGVAVGEAFILPHPPLPLVGVSIGIKKGCHQNDSLVDGKAGTDRSSGLQHRRGDVHGARERQVRPSQLTTNFICRCFLHMNRGCNDYNHVADCDCAGACCKSDFGARPLSSSCTRRVTTS